MATDTKQETQTWWRVSKTYNLGAFDAREVVKVTEKTVTLAEPLWKGGARERREGRDTMDYVWLPSAEAAAAYARDLLLRRRNTLRAQLSRAEAALAAFNAAHPLPVDEV